MKKFSTRTIVIIGAMTALSIVFSRFLSISAWNTKIGFSFAPIALAGMILGPVPGLITGALSDLIGALLFPSGAYFPGFTLTSALTGLVFGLFLYKDRTLLRVLWCVLINQLVMSLMLNTLWISVLYGTPFAALLATRSVQCLIVGPVQFVTIMAMGKIWDRYGERIFRN